MTIIVPHDYHLRPRLQEHRVVCIDPNLALKEDIRALRIGILNIMPKAEQYEFSLLHPLGRSILQIIPVWIRLQTHTYTSSNSAHLRSLYITFEDAIKNTPLDGLIITGAPVEEIPFEEVSYWQEVVDILTFARSHIVSTLGICWGGLALAKMIGIEKQSFNRKLFGVYETRNLDHNHPVTGDLDDYFWCPQSRHSGIPDSVLETESLSKNINLLAHSPYTGYTIFESSDHRFLAHLGHPEYDAQRLVDEYHRDVTGGKSNVNMPVNFNLQNPVTRWRGHRTEFFSQWIKYIHTCISFGKNMDRYI